MIAAAAGRERVTPRKLPARASEFLTRVEFGDVLLLFYFLVFVRPWFWGLENVTAWCLTTLLAVIGWSFYVFTKEQTQRPSLSFWLIVGLPLLVFYGLRATFPDVSFDVWSLRLFHGDRGLTGFIYRPGEFFPTSAPFNPEPDMLTGISRHVFGYRLGTILNFFVLLWTGTVLDKLLRPHVRNARLRAVCILLAIWTEHLLFEINNYMVDLLALPLMLEATWLVLSTELWKRAHVAVRVAFLIAASVTLKLSNGAIAVPLVLICAWRELTVRPFMLKRLAANTIASLLMFAALLLPFMIWVYRLTGSPVFPIYNGYFRSPLYPPSNGWDGRWGGFGVAEILSWPVLIFFHPQRTAELAVYSGRLSLAFIISVICLVLFRFCRQKVLLIAFTIVLASLIWSLTMGYIRYGLYLEVMAGVFIIILISTLVERGLHSSIWRTAIAGLLAAVIIGQSIAGTYYALHQEWSMRPTAIQEFGYFSDESKYLLRDRSIRAWLPKDQLEKFDQVEVWVVCGSKTAGLLPLLNDRPPVIGVRSAGIFTMEQSRREFAKILDNLGQKRMYSLALPEDFVEATAALRNAGLEAGPIEEISVPIFAPSRMLHVYFFEVKRRS